MERASPVQSQKHPSLMHATDFRGEDSPSITGISTTKRTKGTTGLAYFGVYQTGALPGDPLVHLLSQRGVTPPGSRADWQPVGACGNNRDFLVLEGEVPEFAAPSACVSEV